jgi:hypothetical protein
MLDNQQIVMAINLGNGEGSTMHLEVPNKLSDDMQIDEEQLEPR